MAYKILNGDVCEQLKTIDDKSVQCVVTSPPYYGLRNYGIPPSVWGGMPDCQHEWGSGIEFHKTGGKSNKQNTNKGSFFETTSSFCKKCGAWLGCLGLEPTPEMFVCNMVNIFREIRRVMRDDGVVWLNLGDSYAQSGGSGSSKEYQKRHKQFGRVIKSGTIQSPRKAPPGMKPKDLMGIPWMVALALRDDGWYLRSGIPWLKNSAMPESVRDRPSNAIEYFFLLTKNRKYFYDADAIKMPGVIPAGTKAAKGSMERAKQHGVNARPAEYKIYNGKRNRRNTDWFMESIKDILGGVSGTILHDDNDTPIAIFCNPQPYKKAHFATFSPRLIIPTILSGTSHSACEICGAPWERVVARKSIERYELPKDDPRYRPIRYAGKYEILKGKDGNCMRYVDSKTIGWRSTCSCDNEGAGKCIVLDPFAGSGTTLGVAEILGRDSIGIEANKEYCNNFIPGRVAEMVSVGVR